MGQNGCTVAFLSFKMYFYTGANHHNITKLTMSSFNNMQEKTDQKETYIVGSSDLTQENIQSSITHTISNPSFTSTTQPSTTRWQKFKDSFKKAEDVELDPNLTEAERIAPVSYTHLDVYKRQIL